MTIPERARLELERRLDAHRQRRWPQLNDAAIRFRGRFAYITSTMPDGYTQPLFRLGWLNNRETWEFAIWLASKDGYERAVLPNGSFVGTIEQAMDCACGLYLNDPTAWELPNQGFAPPH